MENNKYRMGWGASAGILAGAESVAAMWDTRSIGRPGVTVETAKIMQVNGIISFFQDALQRHEHAWTRCERLP